MEPVVQWEKSNVQKIQGLTPKVRVRFKLSFQQLNPVYEFLLASLLLFSVCCPHFIRGWVDMNNNKKINVTTHRKQFKKTSSLMGIKKNEGGRKGGKN